MCGITGMLGPGADDPSLLERMTQRIVHRGPESQGFHHDGLCALGHRRLSIIDRAGGHEPILDAEGRRAIVYNGEIYNHAALRQSLIAAGARFRTRVDGEVALHLLAGTTDIAGALGRLDGMFAFAIWEPEAGPNGRLLLARDPYGMKPLFWTRAGDTFLFASEMKALLAHPDVPIALDTDAVREKAVFDYLLPGRNWIRGIHSVPPGHYLIADVDSVEVHPYHEPRRTTLPADPGAIATLIDRTLTRAVQKQLMSEVPIGVILSGGLDSSLIAAHFMRHHDGRTLTFSVAGEEDNVDLQAARRVADYLGTDHHERIFTRDDFERDLAQVVWHNEEIDYETYFFHPLFAMMKEHATVALSGQAADEVFGGYLRYRDLAAHRALLKERAAQAYPEEPHRHDRVIDRAYGDLEAALAWERHAQLEQFQLRLVDRHSMAASTEVRVPFLDEDVVAIGRALPQPLLMNAHSEKIALRQAARQIDMPADIIERPKLPAGRRTAGKVVVGFERDAEKAIHDTARRHPFAEILNPASSITLALFVEIFIHNRGERPRDLHWNDLV
jgi:asparagine synthase (glutamine-hydrolysing)